MDTEIAQTMALIAGLAMFVGWVLSDLLEEQMIGSTRRERQRAAKRAARSDRTHAPTNASRPLPRAVARSRSAVASRPAP